jgi:hypothetical protein
MEGEMSCALNVKISSYLVCSISCSSRSIQIHIKETTAPIMDTYNFNLITYKYMFHKYRCHSGPKVESNIFKYFLLQAVAHPKVFPCLKIVRWCVENSDANRRGPHKMEQGHVLGVLFWKHVIGECITSKTLMWKGINQTG